jgi:hypothetical protein
VLIASNLRGLVNRVILFELVFFASVIVGARIGSIGWETAGQVFLTFGIINLLMSIAAWRGWSILRGDASNNAPLSKRDSGEVARDEYALDHERPSTRFIVTIASIGIVAFSIGLVLLLLSS